MDSSAEAIALSMRLTALAIEANVYEETWCQLARAAWQAAEDARKRTADPPKTVRP